MVAASSSAIQRQLGYNAESDLNAFVPWSLMSLKPDISAELLLSFAQAYRFSNVARWSSGASGELYRLQVRQALTCRCHHRLTEGSSQLKTVKAGTKQDRLCCKHALLADTYSCHHTC